MTTKDRRGLALSTDNVRAVERFDEAVDLLNGFYLDFLPRIDEALAEDPDLVMGHCFRATLFAMANERAAMPDLRRSLATAESLAGKANERERMHIAALGAWSEGDLPRAAARLGRIVQEYPRDILALQLAHQADFFLGESRMLRDRVAEILPHWDETVPGYGYVLGMHAFGLEETNLYERAEQTGRQALSLNARDPWAVHAVAHVMEMQGRTADGIDWLEDSAPDWSEGNGFAYHNWWHLALYHLDRGETAQALALYDKRLVPATGAPALEVVDSTALLWRLHLAGIEVGERWGAVADAWEALAGDGFYAFNDAHAMMAFMATGRTAPARKTMAALEAVAEGSGPAAAVTRDVGLPIAGALAAFGAGDYARAADLLLEVRTRAHRFGGSHAQRDAIELTLIEAALRSGDAALARALAAERTALKPASRANRVLTQRALGLKPRAGRELAA
jgi:tetratricopeptide (TPR) repeat protein